MQDSEKYVYNHETKELFTGGTAYTCPAGGLGKAMFENMKKHAKAGIIAQVERETGIEESFKKLLSKCIKIAIFMKEQDIQPGDVISMCSENTLNNSAVLFASIFIGSIIASTDPDIAVEDTKHLLDMVEPKLIFVCEKSTDLIRNATKNCSYKTKIIPLYGESICFDMYTEEDEEKFHPVHIEDTNSTALILFSSGSSGLPKGICLSHNSIVADFAVNDTQMTRLGMTKFAIFTTLYWISGVSITLSAGYFGVTKVVFRKFIPNQVWDDLDKLKVNIFIISYSNGMQCIPYLKHIMPDLKAVVIVGGPIPTLQYNEFKRKLPNTALFVGYGLTETNSIAYNDGSHSPESAYLPINRNIVIKIVDPESGTALDLNQTGEVRVKGKYLMNGYYKKDTANAFDEHGFFKTGDLGYLDDNYRLFIVDRIKEMFKYRAWRVIPAKIEKVLRQHPAVLHAVVLGIPHEEDDNHAVGIVVLKEKVSIAENELMKFVNDKMDNLHQLRGGIKLILEEQIPFTPTGKLNRLKLKQNYLNSAL